jgi:alanine dehydrogenase
MGDKLKVEVEPVPSAAEAVADVDICATCTDSRIPIFKAEWLKLGMHLVNVRPDEMDEVTYAKAERIVTTTNLSFTEYIVGSDKDRKRRPIDSAYRRRYKETNYVSLAAVAAGKEPGRERPKQMTFHHNLSAGFQFAVVGHLVYRFAKENGLGRELPLEWFQEDIRN